MIEVDEIANNLNDVSVEIFSIRNNLYRLADSIQLSVSIANMGKSFDAYAEVKSRLSEAVMLIDDSIAILVDELEAELESDYDL